MRTWRAMLLRCMSGGAVEQQLQFSPRRTRRDAEDCNGEETEGNCLVVGRTEPNCRVAATRAKRSCRGRAKRNFNFERGVSRTREPRSHCANVAVPPGHLSLTARDEPRHASTGLITSCSAIHTPIAVKIARWATPTASLRSRRGHPLTLFSLFCCSPLLLFLSFAVLRVLRVLCGENVVRHCRQSAARRIKSRACAAARSRTVARSSPG